MGVNQRHSLIESDTTERFTLPDEIHVKPGVYIERGEFDVSGDHTAFFIDNGAGLRNDFTVNIPDSVTYGTTTPVIELNTEKATHGKYDPARTPVDAVVSGNGSGGAALELNDAAGVGIDDAVNVDIATRNIPVGIQANPGTGWVNTSQMDAVLFNYDDAAIKKVGGSELFDTRINGYVQMGPDDSGAAVLRNSAGGSMCHFDGVMWDIDPSANQLLCDGPLCTFDLHRIAITDGSPVRDLSDGSYGQSAVIHGDAGKMWQFLDLTYGYNLSINTYAEGMDYDLNGTRLMRLREDRIETIQRLVNSNDYSNPDPSDLTNGERGFDTGNGHWLYKDDSGTVNYWDADGTL